MCEADAADSDAALQALMAASGGARGGGAAQQVGGRAPRAHYWGWRRPASAPRPGAARVDTPR
jgi:hypothetical protein